MTLEERLEDFEERYEEDQVGKAAEIARDSRLMEMALAFVTAVRAYAESCEADERETLFRVRIGAHLLVEEAVRRLEA